MEFILGNLVRVSFSTFNVFFSLVVFLFLLLWYFRVVWYGIVGWNFIAILILQFSVFVLSVLIWLNVLNLVSFSTSAYLFFNLFFSWALAVYFVFMYRDLPLFRKASVLSVLLFIVLLSLSNNDLIVGILSILILIFLFFNVVVVFMSSVRSDILVDFVFFIFVFLLTLLYCFGYFDQIVELILVLGISAFIIVRIMFAFVLSYVSLIGYRKSIKLDIDSISDIIGDVYAVWDNLSGCRNSTQKLVFMLSEDAKRVYSYFRYVGGVIASFYDKVQEVRFSFERCTEELKSVSDKIELIGDSVSFLNNNYVELERILSSLISKVDKDISFFKGISEDFNTSLDYLKDMKGYIQESMESFENLLMELSGILRGISFIEQASIEGSISSKHYGFQVLSDSFMQLKNYSSSEMGEIHRIRSIVASFSNMYYGSVEKISELQEEFYKILSFSDSVVILLGNILSSLSNIRVENVDKSGLIKLGDELDKRISDYEVLKDDLFKSFEVLENMLSAVEDTSEKISTLATSVVYIVDIMESLSRNFDVISSFLKNLKRDIGSILE